MKKSYKDANPLKEWDVIVKFNKPITKNYVVHGKFEGMNYVNAIKYGFVNDFMNGYSDSISKVLEDKGDNMFKYSKFITCMTSWKHNHFPEGIYLKLQVEYNVFIDKKHKVITIKVMNIEDMFKRMMFFKQLSIINTKGGK